MVKALLNPKTKEDVPSNGLLYEIGRTMDIKAQETAAKCGYLTGTINTIAKAKQDYEGGPFAVMFKVMGQMEEEEVDALPIPNTDSGNNPALYKIRTINAKGKPTVKEHNFYKVMSDRLPCNVAKQQRIDMLELSMKDPVQFNVSSVPQDIKDMDQDRRNAEISRLNGELSTSRVNLVGAFELWFHIRAANALKGVTVSIMYALDKEGKELDGQEGRDWIVENTKTPILITTTVEGRKAKDTTQLGVGSFKKLRPAIAREHGETYTALMDSAPTVKRGTKSEEEPGGEKPLAINTKETFYARMVDVHDYMDTITTDSKQTVVASIIGDLSRKTGSDDALVTFTETRDMLTDILEKVFKAGDRYIKIKAAEKEAEEKAA